MPVMPDTVVVELLSNLDGSRSSCEGRTAAEQRRITEGRERRMSSGCNGSTSMAPLSYSRGCFSLGGADDDDVVRGNGSLRFSAAVGPHIFGTGMNAVDGVRTRRCGGDPAVAMRAKR